MDLPGAAPAAAPADEASRAASFEGDPRKWWALAVLLLAQVMIILDIAIVNVAIPSAQADLQIAPDDIQWVVTAYLLPFGGLLLLGGRIADYSGRKRVFCIAAVGFAISSAIGGAAESAGVLFAARACQGFFAAAMAPSLLSMITLGFPRGQDRTRAFSLFGGVSAAGGALGLVLGGLLTEYMSWRWSLLINVPISAIVVAGAIPFLRESRAAGSPRYDLVGAILGTLGLLGIIYGISNASTDGWGATSTLGPLIAGVVVVAIFLVWEAHVRHPLLPLGILLDRTRGGGFLTFAYLYGPGTAMTLLILVFLQGPLGEGALSAGLHFTPIPLAAIFGALISMRLLPRVPARVLIAAGAVIAAIGLLSLTRIDVDATFAEDMLPGFALYGLGSSVLFVAANAIALKGVPDGDTGLASAVINAMQQVGAALGVAILTTVASSRTNDYVAENGPASLPQAIVEGNETAFVLGALIMLGAGLVSALLIRGGERAVAGPAVAAQTDAIPSVREAEPAQANGRSRIPFDTLPQPLGQVARVPGRALVRIGRVLGG